MSQTLNTTPVPTSTLTSAASLTPYKRPAPKDIGRNKTVSLPPPQVSSASQPSPSGSALALTAATHSQPEKRNFHMFSAEAMSRELVKTDGPIPNVPSIRVDSAMVHNSHSTPCASALAEDSASSNSLKLKRVRTDGSRTTSPLTQEREESNEKRAKVIFYTQVVNILVFILLCILYKSALILFVFSIF